MDMLAGHAPSLGSLQRNLNVFVEGNILQRELGPDRVRRYKIRKP